MLEGLVFSSGDGVSSLNVPHKLELFSSLIINRLQAMLWNQKPSA